MSYERASLKRVDGYVAGKQPRSADAIKLNTNENPYPPGQAVMEAMRGVSPEALRRYPSPYADDFRAAAARAHGLDEENVLAVNGGDELVRLAVTTFVDPGRPIGVLEPSYSLYPVVAAVHGSPVACVDLREDWSIPKEAASVFCAAGTQLVFVVAPHAPSGTLPGIDELGALARALPCVLVVDEAYVDFVDPSLEHDAIRLVREHDNVLLLRTLSKGYSLAGLRFGYGLGQRDLIAPMRTKTRDSYNVDAIAQVVATAALENRQAARETWERVRAERERLRVALAALGMTSPASQSNFLLCTIPHGKMAAADVCRALDERGILVRHFATPRLADKLRITVGTPDQNGRLVDALSSLV
jgi:histidinol-phosphate aminotransferase